MIKNILFDWTGTVSDNLESAYCAAMEVFKQYGAKKISLKEYRKEWEQPYMIFFNKYLPSLTIKQQNESFSQAIKYCPTPRPAPGIKILLKQLRARGARLVVISGDSQKYVLAEIRRYGMQGLFKEVNGGIHDKRLVIKSILKRNKFRPDETLIVGDTTHEIDTGKMAGLKTAGVCWGIQTEARLREARPDYLFHDVKALKAVVINNKKMKGG